MEKETATELTPEERMALLKDEVWDMCDIFFVAQENLKVLAYLRKSEDDRDKDFYKRKSMYFDFARKMSWRLVVVELYKLFSREEEYSIRNLILQLKVGGLHEGIITDADITKWETALNGHCEAITKLRLQRNKLVAHKDRVVPDDKAIGISMGETESLVLLFQGIVKKIYFAVTGSDFIVDKPINSPVEDLDKMLNTLAKERKTSLTPLMAEAKRYGLSEDGSTL